MIELKNKMTVQFGEQTILFRQEEYSSELLVEMIPIWKAHYEELAMYKDIPLSPDLDLYRKASESGVLKIFTARDDKKLIGYNIFFVNIHPHFRSASMATQDIIFLLPEMRKGMLGYWFIQWCDEQLALARVNLVYQNTKTTQSFGSILKRLGYVEHDIVYSRKLS